MILSWFKKRRRSRLLAEGFPEAWRTILAGRLEFYSALTEPEQRKLHDDLRVLCAEKHWEGCGGLELTDEKKVLVAGTAALLVLGLEVDDLDRAETILVYPDTFVTPDHEVIGLEIVHEFETEKLGEAWHRGPIVLSWREFEEDLRYQDDGRNLVLHEFAHDLEPAAAPESARKVLEEEYERLSDADDAGEEPLLDPYGATDLHEFWAVATEAFFEIPLDLEAEHPELYAVLREFYRQDPAARARAYS